MSKNTLNNADRIRAEADHLMGLGGAWAKAGLGKITVEEAEQLAKLAATIRQFNSKDE